MEAVPDIIEDIYIKAEIENTEQGYVGNLFSERNGFCEKIKRNKKNGCNSAVNIGQNIFAAAANGGLDACKVVCKKIEY